MKRAWLTGCPVGRVRSSWSTPMPNPHRACRTQCNERWIASRPNSSGPAEKHPTITSRCSSANKCGPRGRSCDWSWKPQRTTRCNARISATSPPPADRPLNLPCRNTRGVDYSSTRYQPSSLRACTQVLRGAGRDQARVSSTLIPAMAARADPPRFLDAHHRTPRYAPSQKRLPNLAGCMVARGSIPWTDVPGPTYAVCMPSKTWNAARYAAGKPYIREGCSERRPVELFVALGDDRRGYRRAGRLVLA